MITNAAAIIFTSQLQLLLELLQSKGQGRKNIDAKTALIKTFGKAFLIPLDVILGWTVARIIVEVE
jgi:hypothetical protein